MMSADEDDPSPLKQGSVMFTAFLAFGFIPLLAYVAFSTVVAPGDSNTLFGIACALTAVALFGLGAFSSRFNSSTWYSQGLWVLGNGTTAAALSYLVGMGVAKIVNDDAVAELVCNATANLTNVAGSTS